MLMRDLGLSQRTACVVVGQNRSTQRHVSVTETVADPDGPLRAELREFARRHACWGQRRALVHVRSCGYDVGRKKVQRLWREEGLRVARRVRRKRAGASTATALVADAPNSVWGIDFQFDATTYGIPFKIANVIDEHTREVLGGQVASTVTGRDLAEELDRIAAERGAWPVALRCDNGPELVCAALADGCGQQTGITFIDPGCPWQNPWIESFHS